MARTPTGTRDDAAAPYITRDGYRALEAELATLWARRRIVVQHLAAAAAEGDRSENAEYLYRKRELRGLDRRIGYLQRRMPRLQIVPSPDADPGQVYFGVEVHLERDDGSTSTVRIVGVDETDAGAGRISVDSPVARALLGRKVSDTIMLPTPAGSQAYVITAIRAVAS